MLLTLSACATSIEADTRRQLPAAPSWVEPVRTPTPKAGDNPIAVAARERAGKAQANKIIIKFKGWYDGVRMELGGKDA